MYCKHCGNELPSPDADICTSCGKIIEKPISSEPIKRPSRAWYLVPIFFGIVGGLAMYLILKDENVRMAKKGLILGIIIGAIGITFLIIIYSVLFGVLAYSHFYNPYPFTNKGAGFTTFFSQQL